MSNQRPRTNYPPKQPGYSCHHPAYRYYSLSDTFDHISRKIGTLALEAGYFTDHMEMQLPYLERRID